MGKEQAPVLIIGGSGIVGRRTAHLLRRLHPGLPIAIGGRDGAKAQAVAAEVGGARGTRIDLDRADLGQPADAAFSAIAVLVKDDTLNAMRYAQSLGVPHVSVSSGTFEIGPEVARFVHHPAAAPILMASQWLCGAVTLPALHFARDYATLTAIRVGLLLDDEDMGGPAAYADYERITQSAPAALALRDGQFVWLAGDEASARYRSVDGTEMEAQLYSPLDVVSLAAATDARTVRIDLAMGVSASRRAGRPFSTEIVIELEGVLPDGERATSRHEIVHPEGQAPLTALGIVLGVERLLGLAGGAPVPAGLYLPEVLIDPAYFMDRLAEFGAEVRTMEGAGSR